jgi:hypothetical protein
MSNNYSEAPAVREVACDLINKYHQHLLRHAVRIEYLFCEKAQKEKGKQKIGTAKRISNLNAYLAGKVDQETGELTETPFFVITIHKASWDFVLSEKQRAALVDHELKHCWAEEDEETGEVVLSILPHDIEEFADIVKRHGRWLEDVDAILKAAEAGPQLTLTEIARKETRRAA